jgi:hypothetical protein
MQKIGADGGRGVNAEQQHEERCHERSAADAREPHDHTDGETGNRLSRVEEHGYAL